MSEPNLKIQHRVSSWFVPLVGTFSSSSTPSVKSKPCDPSDHPTIFVIVGGTIPACLLAIQLFHSIPPSFVNYQIHVHVNDDNQPPMRPITRGMLRDFSEWKLPKQESNWRISLPVYLRGISSIQFHSTTPPLESLLSTYRANQKAVVHVIMMNLLTTKPTSVSSSSSSSSLYRVEWTARHAAFVPRIRIPSEWRGRILL
jgi:hypothetical protein